MLSNVKVAGGDLRAHLFIMKNPDDGAALLACSADQRHHGVPVGGVLLPFTSPLMKPARFDAHHRQNHDLFVEVHDPQRELTGTEHLRHPRGLGIICYAGAYPPSATVDQPVLPALL